MHQIQPLEVGQGGGANSCWQRLYQWLDVVQLRHHPLIVYANMGVSNLCPIASQGLEWLVYHVQTSYNWLGPATVGMPVLLWPQWHAHSTNRTSHLSASRGTQHLHVSLRQMSTTHEHQYSLLMLPSYVAIFIYTGFYDRINQRINCHSSDENNDFFFFPIVMTNKLNKYQP